MPNNDKKRGMDAVAAARTVHEEAWLKLGKVIARKLVEARNVDQENRLRARVSRTISRYNRRLLALKAASVVVGAPSVARIREVTRLVTRVRRITVADAMLRAGLRMIKGALETAREVGNAPRPG